MAEEEEVDTLRGNFSGVACDDCNKQEVVCLHWGELVPPGMKLNLCDLCFAQRQAYYDETGMPLPLQIFNYTDLTNPRPVRFKFLGLQPQTGTTVTLNIIPSPILLLRNPNIDVGRSHGVQFGRTLPDNWLPNVGGKIRSEVVLELIRKGKLGSLPGLMRQAIFNSVATVYIQYTTPEYVTCKIVALDFNCEIEDVKAMSFFKRSTPTTTQPPTRELEL
jgi:hypothetical protein